MHFTWTKRNTTKVEDHGLTTGEVESAFDNITKEIKSRTTGRPAISGITYYEDEILVVYDQIDEVTIYVRAAYKLD